MSSSRYLRITRFPPFAGSMLSSDLSSLILELDTIIMTVLVLLFSLTFIGDTWSDFVFFLNLGY